jgi:hypothetical protein
MTTQATKTDDGGETKMANKTASYYGVEVTDDIVRSGALVMYDSKTRTAGTGKKASKKATKAMAMKAARETGADFYGLKMYLFHDLGLITCRQLNSWTVTG